MATARISHLLDKKKRKHSRVAVGGDDDGEGSNNDHGETMFSFYSDPPSIDADHVGSHANITAVAAGQDGRRSKRLRAAFTTATTNTTGKGRTSSSTATTKATTRKSHALKSIHPNQRRAVAGNGPEISRTANNNNNNMPVDRRFQKQKQLSKKSTGNGTAADPLCLSSDDEDDDEDEDHRDDDEEDDDDNDKEVVAPLVVVPRLKRRKTGKSRRSQLSSPVPHRSSDSRTTKKKVVKRELTDAATTKTRSFRPTLRYSLVPEGVTNIDKIKVNDPTHAVDYVDDMYRYHREKEVEASTLITYLGSPPMNFPKRGDNINERMRSILVDWLIEVHYKFKLFESTLHLTVNIVDRYLQKRPTARRQLQLVGVTALLLASKYEELYIPELRDLTYICDDAYTSDEILAMEVKVLAALDYKLSVPTARTFMERFAMAATMSTDLDGDDGFMDDDDRNARSKLLNLSSRVLDGTLLSYNLIQSVDEGGYLPSQLAAASILIARKVLIHCGTLDCEVGCYQLRGDCTCDWTPTLEYYTRYSKEELVPVARAILDSMTRLKGGESQLIAVVKKYRHSKYGNVSHYALMEESMFKNNVPLGSRNDASG